MEIAPLVLVAAVSLVVGTLVPFIAVLAVEAAIMVVSRLTAARQAAAEPTWDGALLMGLAQAVAILPGVSRSAGTVVSGLWKRVDPVAAAEFSFLMSIPAILGAAVLSLPDLMKDGALTTDATSLAVGMLAAGVCGVLAIRFFIVMLQRRAFWGFAVYCWIAGTLFLLLR
jgi:undecaprenyl-diphosphatase